VYTQQDQSAEGIINVSKLYGSLFVVQFMVLSVSQTIWCCMTGLINNLGSIGRKWLRLKYGTSLQSARKTEESQKYHSQHSRCKYFLNTNLWHYHYTNFLGKLYCNIDTASLFLSQKLYNLQKTYTVHKMCCIFLQNFHSKHF
jgi:hypothetical protein